MVDARLASQQPRAAAPEALRLPGVGPKALLDKLNIDAVADQPSLLIPYNVTDNTSPNLGSLSDPTYAAEAQRLYDEEKTGPYRESGGVVDWEMSVYEVGGLSVVDTSYWPHGAYLGADGDDAQSTPSLL
ncbi:uncharacterized protein B0T15DRAFT_576914 [Chaetomium strumarium]|uniref:Glucose-methanol-choline oxidoreductase C-terminal domain-containing protein n=1 Tax=Chaetomium strumarium TaxID=1170767 RepID=A0AAJ0LZP5_9PEZI|nr:hypothetical protein B0T15DRAFT_576914 [Chaetomium strumarium]